MAEQSKELVKLRLLEFGKEEQGTARLHQEVWAARKDDPEWYNDDANFLGEFHARCSIQSPVFRYKLRRLVTDVSLL